MKYNHYKIVFSLFVFIGLFNDGWAQNFSDTLNLPYKVAPTKNQPYDGKNPSSNVNLQNPENVTTVVEYNEKTNQYTIRKKVGDIDIEAPYTMSFEEYQNYDIQKNLNNHWRKRYKEETFENQKSFVPKINIGGEAFETIFGSSTIDIRPQGSAKLTFGLKHINNENPSQSVELQKSTTFDFKEDIQMNVTGKIGENLEMKISYNTESSFDFENTMNLRYQGKEDDIIQKIEAGDVAMPLTTSLISGSQSLFGILTELKFGNLYVTSVFSQQEGETKTITVEGGAQKSDYELEAVMYDKNRHFFVAHYFRDNYDDALRSLPAVSTPVSITKIEVWVTNTTRETDNARNIFAFMDLGEEKYTRKIYGEYEKSIYNKDIIITAGAEFPDNGANDLYGNVTNELNIRDINQGSGILKNNLSLTGGKDFEKVEFARKLSSNEYTFDNKLGYISLNNSLNADEVLAVAYEYTVGGTGEVYQVGEFSNDGVEHPDALYLKLLKGVSFNPLYPNWNLMMKNIYAIGAYQVNKEDFVMEVEYYDDETGSKLFSLPEKSGLPSLNDDIKGKKLLRLMNLDNLNSNLDYLESGDGVFDFIDNTTINASKGKVIFPVIEPFGGYLKELINDDLLSERYVYNELYDSTQYKAEQLTAKNKFYLSGTYKSSGGSEIFLNAFNIPQGSVKVTAGGIVLQENVDYTVDYNMGRVKVVNQAYLASGTPLKISLESNSMFSIKSKTLMGTHLDYRFNDDFNLGATIMNLTERPLTEKVSIGEEPISNTIWGFNGAYRSDVPFLTRLVDFIPLIETKEMSSITLEGEFAQLSPGHNDAIGKSGEAFIDDFEGSESSIDLRSKTGWVLASTPQLMLDAGDNSGSLVSGYSRAKLAWYQIDPLFFRTGSPVSKEQQENLQVYRPDQTEIYPNKDLKSGQSTEISTLDLAFFPEYRGPYNYDADDIDADGKLINTRSRWGGIMRELSTNDFEASNVEYIEFWMMDPFVEDDSANTGGKLYFNLGNVSEDILKDGRKSYEHGMPTDGNSDGYSTTAWGRVPALQTANPGFVNDGNLRELQDIGLDGLSSKDKGGGENDENIFFANFMTTIRGKGMAQEVLQQFEDDPSNDDYEYFRSNKHDENNAGIIERYLRYNNHEGNTPVSENAGSSYNTTGQQYPDVEDINGDFTLSENEAYFQYEISIDENSLEVGTNHITDERFVTKSFGNVRWLQFKVPINAFTDRVNDISDFKSIRFMRMFLTDWDSSIVIRFAKLELVRGEWRKYDYVIKDADEGLIPSNENYDANQIPFSISSVNIEENSEKIPVNYVLPNGVDRQQDPSNPQLSKLNEQAMVLKVDELEDGFSKAVYKTINMDMRDYGKLKMYVHAEAREIESSLDDKDVAVFVRIGSDYTDNYYEYEVPANVTPWGKYINNHEDRDAVWPEANNVLIDFDHLTDLKMERNANMRKANPTASLLVAYTKTFDQKIGKDSYTRRITIKGNPNLAQVKTIMIGVRNPLERFDNIGNGGSDVKSAEIWVNELRLTDFDEEGGWAATGRMTMRLADFGTVSVAGSTTQAGFGSIEQKGQERSKDEINQVDVAANLELGKFFPKESNVRIPLYLGYSRTAINPEYNPVDQDILLNESLNDPSLSKSEKEDLKDISQDLTERKSLNFTNVGIGRAKGKPKFYSPSNITASYAFSEIKHHDVSTKYNTTKNYSGGLNYVFNSQPKNIKPFKKNKLLRKPALKLIGDFNFYYAPAQVSFQTNMNRRYNETLLRNLNNPQQVYLPSYNKNFDWNRKFNIKYNFSKGLKFDYAINTNALIDELEGNIKDDYERHKDTVWNSILSMGTPLKHNQKFNASYTIPINKIPIFNWLSATARYSSLYNWDKGPLLRVEDSISADSVVKREIISNSINNSQKITLNAQANMDNLYNKVGFLKKINKKYKKNAKQRKKPKFETVEYKKEGVRFTGGKVKMIMHNLRTEEEIEVTLTEGTGKPIKIDFDIESENKVSIRVNRNFKNVTVVVKGKREVNENLIIVGLEQTARLLMGFKQISGSYSQTNGSILAGYKGEHDFGSLNDEPGLAFVFGMQDTALPYFMYDRNLLISETSLITPYKMTNTETVNLKTTFQPFKGLRVDFTAKWNKNKTYSEYFTPMFDDNIGSYLDNSNEMYAGSYSIDIWMINTAFSSKYTNTNTDSKAYDQYRENLYEIAWQYADKRVGNAPGDYNNGNGYNPGMQRDSFPTGYNSSNPEVAIPAFLAAYSGNDANSAILDIFSLKKLRPAWRVKFDGLGTLKIVKKYFRNITITHGYNSAFMVSSFYSNVLYNHEQAKNSKTGNMSWETGKVDNTLFISEYDITTFAAVEQFMPLIGIDLTWKSNVLSKFEYKKTRALTVSLANNMMTEVYTWDYVIGTGYRFDDLKLKINNKPIVSDLNLRADLSIRDGITVNRDIVQQSDEVIAGQNVFTLKFTADYQLSDKLTMQLYFDHTLTDPKTSVAYRNSLTNFGFMFQFSLAQ